jgi:hypothetical protein
MAIARDAPVHGIEDSGVHAIETGRKPKMATKMPFPGAALSDPRAYLVFERNPHYLIGLDYRRVNLETLRMHTIRILA